MKNNFVIATALLFMFTISLTRGGTIPGLLNFHPSAKQENTPSNRNKNIQKGSKIDILNPNINILNYIAVSDSNMQFKMMNGLQDTTTNLNNPKQNQKKTKKVK